MKKQSQLQSKVKVKVIEMVLDDKTQKKLDVIVKSNRVQLVKQKYNMLLSYFVIINHNGCVKVFILFYKDLLLLRVDEDLWIHIQIS